MTPPFLTRLFEFFCRHEFTWPHTGIHGKDYQVCLLCGAAYEFDCATMQRTGRLAAVPAPPATRLRPTGSL